MTDWIPDDDWATIVAHVPIVSVDLVVCCGDGIVLGKRRNDPGRNEWFVPGGRVHKGERRRDAVGRIAREELGADVTIREEIGTYEHFWDAADVPGVADKHYVATGYVVGTDADPDALVPDDQHAELRVFETVPDDVHRYTADYLRDADAVDR